MRANHCPSLLTRTLVLVAAFAHALSAAADANAPVTGGPQSGGSTMNDAGWMSGSAIALAGAGVAVIVLILVFTVRRSRRRPGLGDASPDAGRR